jgi:DNA-binding NarL/FixJ family response regulator
MARAATRRLPAEHGPVGPDGKSPGPAPAGPRTGPPPPEGPAASLVVLCSNGEDVASDLGALRARFPDAACLVLCPRPDPEVARTALRWGARGFVHAGMPPEQLARAVEVASRGETVIPRGLLELLIASEAPAALLLDGLSARQREILGLVSEGLSNAQIAARLFLSVSTVKQHLSAAYKTLRVKNRTQAARAFRRVGSEGGG